MSWTPDRVADELLSAGRLFRLPQGGPPAFVTAEEYLSGDVREKLRVAERWTNLSPAFARNVEALRAALPAPVPREDVAVGLGAGFVPPEVVEEFAYHLLPTMYRGGVKAVYVVATATWILDWCGGAVVKTSHHNLSTWGTTRVDAMSLLEHALRNESPVVYDTDPRTEERVRNAKATAEAQAKLADLRAEWDRWWRATTSSVLFPSGELRKVGDVLHEAYEAEFNRYSPRRYDGRHLRFPGLAATLPGTDAAFAPRRHQLDGALRILERNVPDDTFLLGYDVGLGKTLAAILGAEGESPVALKTAAIKLRQVSDTAAAVTGKAEHGEIVGALLAVPTKLSRGAKAQKELASFRAEQETKERWALAARLNATGAVNRSKIFADVLNPDGTRKMSANGKPVVRIRSRYARMDLAVFRGLVTDLEGDAPKKRRNPFEPDEDAAKQNAKGPAAKGEPSEAQITAAMKLPAVQTIVQMTGRDPRQVAAEHLKTLAATSGKVTQ